MAELLMTIKRPNETAASLFLYLMALSNCYICAYCTVLFGTYCTVLL